MPVSDFKSNLVLKTFRFRYKETYGTITSENLEYFLTNWLL